MTDARTEVLARLRTALGPSPTVPDVPRAYRRTGDHAPGSPALLDLLAERVGDYRATVHRCRPDTVPALLGRLLPAGCRVAVPAGLPDGWTSDLAGDVVVDDGGLTADDLDVVDAVLTGAAAAVAETGTVVLDSSPRCGRRILSLVPDHHVLVVAADQVVETVPEALARLDPGRPLTFVSGPSATSDIELERVEGVHGPRRLEVVLLDPLLPQPLGGRA